MKKWIVWLCLLLTAQQTLAHPMPGSLVNLSVLENVIQGEARIPFAELENALGIPQMQQWNSPFLRAYLAQHIRAVTDGKPWTTRIEELSLTSDHDAAVGDYKELLVRFSLTPPDKTVLRRFTFQYDVVIHQVVTHSAIVNVRQDWHQGIQEDAPQQIGVIRLDIPTGKIYPLEVSLSPGSWWQGFRSMMKLGTRHIAEGTDHLIFLLVLLLPAPLLVAGRRWAGFGGVRYSLVRLLKIVTAFTIGHSVTLLLGSLGWVRLPSQPVEILIAFSILVSAVHAFRPLFPGREIYVAAGFGLIHGLAFAATLTNLHLDAGPMALSILGFNLGIEAMQLFVIALTVPWLIVLSRRPAYQYLRMTGAVVAALAALAWMAERISGSPNGLSATVELLAANARWFLFVLALLAFASFLLSNKSSNRAAADQ